MELGGDLAPSRPFYVPVCLPAFLLLFTETKTIVSSYHFHLCHSLLGVWLEHLRTATVTSPAPDSTGQAAWAC